jgi:hypothetical protein
VEVAGRLMVIGPDPARKKFDARSRVKFPASA